MASSGQRCPRLRPMMGDGRVHSIPPTWTQSRRRIRATRMMAMTEEAEVVEVAGTRFQVPAVATSASRPVAGAMAVAEAVAAVEAEVVRRRVLPEEGKGERA